LWLAHVEDGDTVRGPVLIDFLRDGVVVGLSEVALFLLEKRFKLFSLTIVPDGYVSVHNTSLGFRTS